MKYNQVLGSFLPSYLLIKINTKDSLSNIRSLQKDDQAYFFHEYTHFLQNITTGFGHSHIWNTYDRLRQIISSQQKNGLPELQLPIDYNASETQRLFFRVMRAVSGSKHVTANTDDDTCEIVSLMLVRDENFQKLYPDSNVFFIKTQIKDASGSTGDYMFGETAVSEAMAYLIETKFHVGAPFRNFPYRACKYLGKYLGTNFLSNDEWLFALCDIAMQSMYPGWMFYQILLEITQTGFNPGKTEDIYQFGETEILKHGMNIKNDFKAAKEGSIVVLKELFNQPFFNETLTWLLDIIEKGYEVRRMYPFFMLNLYREKDYFKGYWEDTIATFGTPQLYNYYSERFFRAPVSLSHIENQIEPLFLVCSQQVNNTLIGGKSDCELYTCCSSSKNGLVVDQRCHENPWERANDKMLCAYAALWASYGLNKKKVIM